jgi:hypothetical protein
MSWANLLEDKPFLMKLVKLNLNLYETMCLLNQYYSKLNLFDHFYSTSLILKKKMEACLCNHYAVRVSVYARLLTFDWLIQFV